jgi:hypothetical protein
VSEVEVLLLAPSAARDHVQSIMNKLGAGAGWRPSRSRVREKPRPDSMPESGLPAE